MCLVDADDFGAELEAEVDKGKQKFKESRMIISMPSSTKRMILILNFGPNSTMVKLTR